MRIHLMAAALPLALLAAPLHAQFTPTGGSFGSLPQATFGGSGIPNNAVQMGHNVGGVDLGLTATQRFTSPALTNDGAGTFFATPGFDASAPFTYATWNFDFYVGGSGAGNYFYTLFIDNNPGTGTITFGQYDFDASSFIAGANQNSFNIGMGFIGGDPTASGEYTYALVQYREAARLNVADQIAIQVDVTSTPEPASMVLLGTGLVGVFGVARRRKRA